MMILYRVKLFGHYELFYLQVFVYHGFEFNYGTLLSICYNCNTNTMYMTSSLNEFLFFVISFIGEFLILRYEK
jgi:hypothetical protein